MEDVDFNIMHLWVQVHGLSLEMFNPENEKQISDSLGRCVGVEPPSLMKLRSYLRVRVAVDVKDPLTEGFTWTS